MSAHGPTWLLRSEFTKFRSVPSWMIALCAAAAAFVLLSFASAFESHSASPAVPVGPGGEAVTDSYSFVHRTLVGDGAITARVASFSGAHTSLSSTQGGAFSASSKGQPSAALTPGLASWAKAGIILEPGTSQGTRYAAVMVTGDHGVQMQYDYTHDLPGPAGRADGRWLRLTRAGDVVSCYDSADGVHWMKLGAARLAGLPRTVQIGLFVASPAYFAAGADTGGTPALPSPGSYRSPPGATCPATTGPATRSAAPPLPPRAGRPLTRSRSAGRATSRHW